jgi:hypothetical protein
MAEARHGHQAVATDQEISVPATLKTSDAAYTHGMTPNTPEWP